jgi:hypothetical protein
MFVAFMLLHFLLCDEVPSYIISCIEVVCSLNLNLNQNSLNFYKKV